MKDAFEVDECVFPEATILSLRAKDSLMAMGKYMGGLYRMARERGLKPTGPIYTVYYEKPEGNAPLDYEMCVPVEGRSEELDKLEDRGGDRCLHLRVKGSYAQFGEAYAALAKAAEARGLKVSGPPREVYTRGPLLGFMTFIPTMVTDIYFPIT
jgi:effector-binding domain-containing protein